MRFLPSAGAAALAVAASVLLAPAAFATGAPGDNGTIKIHDAKTGEELVKNEPKVCSFYLDAFFFDGLQEADWKIVEMPPTGTKGELATSGAITLDGEGHGRTTDMTLPDGHYKLVWNFDAENGAGKHKVFWTDCAASGGTTAGGTTVGGTSGGGTPTASPTPTVADTSSPSPSVSATGPGSSASSSAAGGTGEDSDSGGSLASTGASVLGLTGAAAVLLAVGVAVRFRRRGGLH
jgi:hypothetical protein